MVGNDCVCVLCVLFKTDGRFTLAEMSDKQLRKDGGKPLGHKQRDTAVPLIQWHRHSADARCGHPRFSRSVSISLIIVV